MHQGNPHVFQCSMKYSTSCIYQSKLNTKILHRMCTSTHIIVSSVPGLAAVKEEGGNPEPKDPPGFSLVLITLPLAIDKGSVISYGEGGFKIGKLWV